MRIVGSAYVIRFGLHRFLVHWEQHGLIFNDEGLPSCMFGRLRLDKATINIVSKFLLTLQSTTQANHQRAITACAGANCRMMTSFEMIFVSIMALSI